MEALEDVTPMLYALHEIEVIEHDISDGNDDLTPRVGGNVQQMSGRDEAPCHQSLANKRASKRSCPYDDCDNGDCPDMAATKSASEKRCKGAFRARPNSASSATVKQQRPVVRGDPMVRGDPLRACPKSASSATEKQQQPVLGEKSQSPTAT